jgi:protein ImuB
MKRIACIRLPERECKLPIDEPTQSIGNLQFPVSDLQCLVEHCRRFSPIVGLEPTNRQDILLDLTGLAHLFGSENAICESIIRDFFRQGLDVRLAVAGTIGAAWAAAHYGNLHSVIVPHGNLLPFLSPLPIEALRLPSETVQLLHELGIADIGQVEALPRREFSSRFGPMLLTRLDQAFGRLNEPVPAAPAVPRFAAAWTADYPTSRRETIETVLEHLIRHVSAMLAGTNLGVLWLECGLDLDGSHLSFSVGLFQPTATAAHLFQLMRLRLERLRIPAPVVGVHVAATLTAPLEPRRQTTLFDACTPHAPRAGPTDSLAFAALVERLSSRLGRQAVTGVRLRPEAQPELAWHYDPLVNRRRRRRVVGVAVGVVGVAVGVVGVAVALPPRVCGCGSTTAAPTGSVDRRRRRHQSPRTLPAELPPRPLRLLPRPWPVEATSLVPDGPPLRFQYAGRQEHIVQSWGPERIETGWWRGRPVGRDYFRVQTSSGTRFWLFRRLRDGKWFLHGSFD